MTELARLLVTARDAAAALHLIEIVRFAKKCRGLDITVAAQMPAARYFLQAGIPTTVIELPSARERECAAGDALLREARRLVAEVKPDAILCGLSTPFDGGIDEAVQKVHGRPTFVMQDFWGEANRFFGGTADHYFALDGEGVRLTRERFGLEAEAVGSPRHSAYAGLDLAAMQSEARSGLGVCDTTPVIGFFGQALHSLDGYARTVRAWASAVRQMDREVRTIFRPHPRQSAADKATTVNLLQGVGIECVVFDELDVEHALLACDVACSAFSNCTYDAAYLNYFSSRPLITPVSLLFDPEIVDYFRRMVRVDDLPYLKSGLALAVRTPDELSRYLTAAATETEKHRYWKAAKGLSNPALAPKRVLDSMARRLVARA